MNERMARIVAFFIASIITLAALLGCGFSAFHRADCTRTTYPDFHVIACDDAAVGRHCRRASRSVQSPHVWIKGKTDSGGPVNYYPRACYSGRPAWYGRKPVIAIGRSFLGCLLHEDCHRRNPGEAAMCERDYPCVGDRR
ncbi:MAG: hypothetical protein QME60_01290 [Verrucomicrobiota bacterium]|nr:hypothetical protein [Verrucomicrobiota bacterium]